MYKNWTIKGTETTLRLTNTYKKVLKMEIRQAIIGLSKEATFGKRTYIEQRKSYKIIK